MTIYEPGDPEHDRVDESEVVATRLFWEREQVKLLDEGVSLRLIVAENPDDRVGAIVVVPIAEPVILILEGVAPRL